MSTDNTAEEQKRLLLEKEGFDFNAFEYENEYSAKAILKAMEAYATQKMGAYKAPVGLKEYLQSEVDRLESAVHGTDQYGYRGAMQNIIRWLQESPTPSPIEKLIGQINADVYLELINDIMWNTWAVKDHPFGREQGEEIMKVLNQWTKSESQNHL
jgi:hypothetical protein